MADDKTANVQDGKEAEGGQDDRAQDEQPPKVGPEEQRISRESWNNLLGEKKRTQDENRKLKAELEKYESAKKKQEEEKLKADGKLQELISMKDKEMESLKNKIRKSELRIAAQISGMIDLDYVDLLLPSVQFDEDDRPKEIENIFRELKEKKPYLFAGKSEAEPKLGTNNAKATWKTDHIFTEKEILAMDSVTRDKNWPEIQRQMQAGLIK